MIVMIKNDKYKIVLDAKQSETTNAMSWLKKTQGRDGVQTISWVNREIARV